MGQCTAKTKDGTPCEIPTREGQKYCHVHRKKSFFRSTVSFSAIGLLLLGILGFASDITGVLSYFGFTLPSPTENSIILETQTPTITLTVSPTPSPTATATPIFIPAANGESLIIVANFDNRRGDTQASLDYAQYIYERLIQQIQEDDFNIRVERYYETLDENSVIPMIERHNATLVIWGWFDAETVNPRIERSRSTTDYGENNKYISFDVTEATDEEMQSLTSYITLFILGQDRFENEKYEEAITYFIRAINIAPDNLPGDFNLYEAYCQLGRAYSYNGNNENAIQALNEAIRLEPRYYAWPYSLRGWVYQKMDQHNNAISDLNKAIGINPEYSWPYELLASVYIDLNEYNKALDVYDRIRSFDPQRAVFGKSAVYYRYLNEKEKAIEILENELGNFQDNGIIYFGIGDVYYEFGEFDKAILSYSKAIDINPNDTMSLGHRGYTYMQLGRYDEAYADYMSILNIEPEDVWALSTLGETLVRLGKTKEAIVYLEKSLGLDEWGNYWTYYQMYLVYITDNPTLADQYLDKTIELAESDYEKYADNGWYQEEFIDLAMFYLIEGDCERSYRAYDAIFLKKPTKAKTIYAIKYLSEAIPLLADSQQKECADQIMELLESYLQTFEN